MVLKFFVFMHIGVEFVEWILDEIRPGEIIEIFRLKFPVWKLYSPSCQTHPDKPSNRDAAFSSQYVLQNQRMSFVNKYPMPGNFSQKQHTRSRKKTIL